MSTSTVHSAKTLLPFAAALLIGMTIVQAVIALTSGRPGILSMLLTAAIVLGCVFWQWRNIKTIAKIRFGKTIVHSLMFAIITTSFSLHALMHFTRAAKSGNAAELATEFFATPWFGATISMSALWGLGFIATLISAIAQRGWED